MMELYKIMSDTDRVKQKFLFKLSYSNKRIFSELERQYTSNPQKQTVY